MKKNGFVLSTYIYMLLVFFLLLLVVMLSVLSNTKVLSKKLKENATEKSALKSSSFSLVLLGDKDFVVAENDEFIDPGVIAKTKAGKDLTNSVLITSNVDTSVEGEYQVTYRLSYNGLTKEVVRNVIVGKTTIIVLDANGGVCSTGFKTILKDDYVGELPIPTYSEKTFLGWYTGLTNGEIVTDNTTLGDADIITLYAHWVKSKFTYDYTGDVQVFTAPIDGYYRLNVWGAQGGGHNSNNGGYGGYSTGVVRLYEGDKLYVYVGGKGQDSAKVAASIAGGYNGGGNSYGTTSKYLGSGGGATHIATVSGILSSLSEYAGNNNSPIMIVAGGGGAGGYESSSYSSYGGNGGGLAGNISTTNNTSYTKGMGGTQTSAGTGLISGSFGQGGIASSDGTGGGGGYYGGGAGQYTSGGGGGSGYIGNELLYSKAMYCYNCTESSVASVKTVNTTCVSDSADENCSKQGNGYAMIEYVKTTEEDVLKETPFEFDYSGDVQVFTAPIDGYYRLNVWGAQGGSYNSTYYGGYGGYSTGIVSLAVGEKIYIYVGGAGINGTSTNIQNGGYNGGGKGNYHGGSGGGATHIATTTGLLSSLSSNPILIVAGGGGGGAYTNTTNGSAGGSGGGYVGTNGNINALSDTNGGNGYGTGGTQSAGGSASNDGSSSLGGLSQGSFGKGADSKLNNSSYGSGGGGGGYYGGGASTIAGAGGGSGYIGNSLLSNKVMYCYNCTESSDVSTKTVSTTCVSATATANCSKQGNGYAKITYIGD